MIARLLLSFLGNSVFVTSFISVLLLLVGGCEGTTVAMGVSAGSTLPVSNAQIPGIEKGFGNHERAASDAVARVAADKISSIEWLAPLAPVALSPFFGITLLSGLACFGPEWLPDNALLSEGSPLANPLLFWIFLALTLLTSAPRFSKVSKPIAQLADFLETWSAIVILLVLKLSTMAPAATESAFQSNVVHAGVLDFGWEALLMVAMSINIVVVNTVKFFFEFLVWITPIPMLDACFELANKTICAALMAVYAASPVVALVINLLLFAACALVFVWVRRRELFFRTMLFEWLGSAWHRLRGTTQPKSIPEALVVFPRNAIGEIPARARCLLRRRENSWQLEQPRLLRASVLEQLSGDAELEQGWWTNAICGEDWRLSFGTRYCNQLVEVAEKFQLEFVSESQQELPANRQLEFT